METNTFALPQIGLHHPRVRQLRKIANNLAPNHHRLFAAEGLWAHEVLLQLDAAIDLFLWCPEASISPGVPAIAQRCAALAREAFRISPKVLERISERDRPDGVISLAALPQWDAQTLALRPDALVLVADAIEIPGNLGTLLRTLDACGATALLLTNRRTRLSHPKVFRGSRGMNLRVPVLEFAEVDEAVDWLRRRDFSVYLATAGTDAVDYRRVRFRGRTAFRGGQRTVRPFPAMARFGPSAHHRSHARVCRFAERLGQRVDPALRCRTPIFMIPPHRRETATRMEIRHGWWTAVYTHGGIDR